MMYNPFFNLQQNPFGETPDPYFFFASKNHHSVLEKLSVGFGQGRGFQVLTGEVGTGKTLLSRVLLQRFEKTAQTALIFYPHLNEAELISAICDELRVPASTQPDSSLKAQLDRLNSFLIESALQGKRTLLVIDEAQELPIKTLETIRLLTNLETERHKLLQILLIGQPELNGLLSTPELRQLSQRVSNHEVLRPLTVRETEDYIRHRLERVGAGNVIRFDPGAVELICQISGGLPRNINRTCEKMVDAAAQAKVHLITRAHCRKVHGAAPRDRWSVVKNLFKREARSRGEMWNSP